MSMRNSGKMAPADPSRIPRASVSKRPNKKTPHRSLNAGCNPAEGLGPYRGTDRDDDPDADPGSGVAPAPGTESRIGTTYPMETGCD